MRRRQDETGNMEIWVEYRCWRWKLSNSWKAWLPQVGKGVLKPIFRLIGIGPSMYHVLYIDQMIQ